MAAPHGVKLKDLKCDLTDYTAAQAHLDSRVLYMFLFFICTCLYKDAVTMIVCRKDARDVNTWTPARLKADVKLYTRYKSREMRFWDRINGSNVV